MKDLEKMNNLQTPKLAMNSDTSTQISCTEFEIDFESEEPNENEYPKEVKKILK